MTYRWLMIIHSSVLSNSRYWSLMVAWSWRGRMRWGLSGRRPSSRDKKSVWAPQVEAVWVCRTADMLFKGARTETPLIIKLNCNRHAFLVRQERCAAKTTLVGTAAGRTKFGIKVVQISCCMC